MATTLTHLSNDSLLSGIKELVHSERRLTTEIIHHLREIVRRDLHLKLGYNSLFTYMVEELKYCEGSAHRRISAMHLLDSIPVAEAKKVEAKINSGAMSLTTVAMVQDLVRHKKKENAPMSISEKLVVLQSIEGLSKRETEKALIAKAPEMVVAKEKERVLTAELTELKIVLDEKTLAKLKRIKELRAHVNANPTYSELINDMADLLLKKLDPMPDHETGNSTQVKNKNRPEKAPAKLTEQQPQGWDGTGRSFPFLEKLHSRHIPTKLRQQIWQKYHGRCTYKNPQTSKTCNSTHLLQIEHIIPYAKQGPTTPENLTLLCANHNQMRAREEFSTQKKHQLHAITS